MPPTAPTFTAKGMFALSLVFFALGLFALVISIGNNSSVQAAGPCQLDDVPFAAGLSLRDPIYAINPSDSGAPEVFEIDAGGWGTISTSRQTLCDHLGAASQDQTTMPDPCIDMDAFTFGLDWVPLVDGDSGGGEPDLEVYDLNPLNGSVGNETGWGIMYVEREGGVYALGWGAELFTNWPAAQNDKLVDLSTQLDMLNENDALYAESVFSTHGDAELDGLDFNSWVLGQGQVDVSHCFSPPPQTGSPVRIYYSAPPRDGYGDGSTVHWITPLYDGSSWTWSAPEVLCNAPIPDLDVGVDNIDALSYQPPLNGDSGFLMFSLDEDVEPHNSELERGEPFYAVEVLDNGNGKLSYGRPRPVRQRGGVPLRDIVGKNSKGVCTTDPRFLVRNETPCTCEGGPRE